MPAISTPHEANLLSDGIHMYNGGVSILARREHVSVHVTHKGTHLLVLPVESLLGVSGSVKIGLDGSVIEKDLDFIRHTIEPLAVEGTRRKHGVRVQFYSGMLSIEVGPYGRPNTSQLVIGGGDWPAGNRVFRLGSGTFEEIDPYAVQAPQQQKNLLRKPRAKQQRKAAQRGAETPAAEA